VQSIKQSGIENGSGNSVEENFLKILFRLDERMLDVEEADKVISKGRISY
jgi:hypothetical protein